MSPRTLVVVQRLALLAAIFASAALLIDYQNIGDPTFCGAESSCFKVRASDVGRDLAGLAANLSVGRGKVTVPHVGIFAHVILLALALAASTRFWVRVVAGAATLGALSAVYLLIAQLRMGELCPWCAVVDVSSIVSAVSSVLLARAAQNDPAPAWGSEAQTATSVVVWSAAAAAMVALPHLWMQFSATAPLPPQIQALQVPGKVTVVSFTDFECPFCRKLGPTLAPLHDDPAVAFKRYMAPLEMHPGAKPAALAYLCVEEAIRDDFARLLYEAPDGAFSAGNLEWIAVHKANMKTSREDFEACMKSPDTALRLRDEMQLFADAGGSGLPTTWVGRRMVKGFQPDKIALALESEKRGSGLALPVWLMLVAAAAVAAWTTAMHVRAARALAAAAAPTPGDGSGGAREKKERRPPVTTFAETPRAKRTRGSEENLAGPDAEPKDADVIVSKDPDPNEGSGEKA